MKSVSSCVVSSAQFKSRKIQMARSYSRVPPTGKPTMEPEMTLSVPMTLHIDRRTQNEKSSDMTGSLPHTHTLTRGPCYWCVADVGKWNKPRFTFRSTTGSRTRITNHSHCPVRHVERIWAWSGSNDGTDLQNNTPVTIEIQFGVDRSKNKKIPLSVAPDLAGRREISRPVAKSIWKIDEERNSMRYSQLRWINRDVVLFSSANVAMSGFRGRAINGWLNWIVRFTECVEAWIELARVLERSDF